MTDPIVEEVRKARYDHAKEFYHDLAAICNDLKRIEKKYSNKLVSLAPKLLIKTSKRKKAQ